ncbi:MAG: acetoacetate decarboxylase [Phycisphaerales bacterium]|nr:acetoacetate decarboxylase [Phycisphaerales bacterium]
MNKDPLKAWSTPLAAPLEPAFPFSYRDVEVLTLVYRTHPEAVRRQLPAPLEPVSDMVLIHLYNMRDVDYLGPYGECNVMVGAELPGKIIGGYSPFLFLNSDAGLAQGRTVHGQPKKWGNPRVEIRGDLIVGILERNGIDVVTGTMGYKRQRGDIADLKRDAFDFAVNLNFKVIQHIDGRMAICQITSRALTDVQIHECWRGPCTVELRPHVLAPLHQLPVIETMDAYYWRASFSLVAGTIVHDYLERS